MTSYDEIFITGCDSKTRWMLPWFEQNFYKHNPNCNLHVYDFDKHFTNDSHWFKKPLAMLEATKIANKVCWLDTDIEVRAPIFDIFNFIHPLKLTMVEDGPWSLRRGETWHNSGVVAFEGRPAILEQWASATTFANQVYNPLYGDQDILHKILKKGMNRLIHINTISKSYNTLRLDLTDNTAPKDIKCMHWTGRVGKEAIRKQING